MIATYVREGEILEYKATNAVERGEVVALVSGGVGVASDEIPAGGAGHLHIVGVFAMPKKAGEAVAAGALLYFDAANGVVTATKDTLTVVAGMAAAPADAAAAMIDVRLANPV
ncbi:capsid cement protein [Bacillota bacterium Meth-B3]